MQMLQWGSREFTREGAEEGDAYSHWCAGFNGALVSSREKE